MDNKKEEETENLIVYSTVIKIETNWRNSKRNRNNRKTNKRSNWSD